MTKFIEISDRNKHYHILNVSNIVLIKDRSVIDVKHVAVKYAMFYMFNGAIIDTNIPIEQIWSILHD